MIWALFLSVNCSSQSQARLYIELIRVSLRQWCTKLDPISHIPIHSCWGESGQRTSIDRIADASCVQTGQGGMYVDIFYINLEILNAQQLSSFNLAFNRLTTQPHIPRNYGWRCSSNPRHQHELFSVSSTHLLHIMRSILANYSLIQTLKSLKMGLIAPEIALTLVQYLPHYDQQVSQRNLALLRNSLLNFHGSSSLSISLMDPPPHPFVMRCFNQHLRKALIHVSW